MGTADFIVLIITLYAVAGVIVALPLVLKGITKIDPTAEGSTWGFRVVIFPACVALWPMMLTRWARARPGSVESHHA
ncbi:MAG: hypothetical protein GC164_13015 [Phycisphaera sp.]|nr:hypothetical protein [Phycisphaera sp.]